MTAFVSRRWYHSLQARIRLAAGGVLLLLALAIAGVIARQGEPRMVRQTERLIHQSGAALCARLAQPLIQVETLTATLAALWPALPRDAALMQALLPPLIDLRGNRAIAGGGLWPETEAFTPGQARRSFFWARQPDGTLRYLDDYNDPAGNGYHHDDWYRAGRDAPQGRCAWSPAYVDPHSRAPMVTCTVPLLAPRFAGVATVDVDLGGLATFLASLGCGAISLLTGNDPSPPVWMVPEITQWIWFRTPYVTFQSLAAIGVGARLWWGESASAAKSLGGDEVRQVEPSPGRPRGDEG